MQYEECSDCTAIVVGCRAAELLFGYILYINTVRTGMVTCVRARAVVQCVDCVCLCGSEQCVKCSDYRALVVSWLVCL